MNTYLLKARLWMYGPFILGGLVFLVLLLYTINVIFLTEKGGQVYQYGSPFTLKDPEELQKAFLMARGGEAELTRIRSIRQRGTLETKEDKIPFISIKKRPWQSLLTFKFSKYELSFIVDGDVVWKRVTLTGKEPIVTLVEGDEAVQIRRLGAFFDPVVMLFLFNRGEIQNIEIGEWSGQEALIVDFENPDLKLQSKAYIDPKTMHVLARVDIMEDGTKRDLSYFNHQKFNGLLQPKVTTTALDGIFDNRVTIEHCDYNIGAIPSVFEFPAPKDS